MPTLLIVETSPRGEFSVSRNMTKRFVDEWKVAFPEGEIITRDLMTTELPFVTAPWLQAYFTPPEQHSTDMKHALSLSDRLVGELIAADHVVIATPVYNYNVPAALKAWIDHIVRKGMTLGHDGKGLLHAKTATVLLASGGIYTEGSPIRDRDIATQYLRLVLNVIGITDVTFIDGGGAKAVDLGEQTMTKFLDNMQPAIEQAARDRSKALSV
jgi:FMN-dependent NADH-azoreductase